MGDDAPKRRQTGKGEPWTAERVAKLRADLGLTQAVFADQLGVRQQTVSEWETGRYQPRGASARLLQILADERFAYDPHAVERKPSDGSR
jgi:DNA-binding transcriptional regulator YiaG